MRSLIMSTMDRTMKRTSSYKQKDLSRSLPNPPRSRDSPQIKVNNLSTGTIQLVGQVRPLYVFITINSQVLNTALQSRWPASYLAILRPATFLNLTLYSELSTSYNREKDTTHLSHKFSCISIQSNSSLLDR